MSKFSIIEVVLTVIIVLVACFGIGVAVSNRVEKGSGQLTMENYTEYMQVDCTLGNGFGGGGEMWYTYYITVSAAPYYKLVNVTVNYELKSNGAKLPDGTLTVTVDAGESFQDEHQDKFTVTTTDGALGMWDDPTLEITIKSVTGTYSYSI